MIEYYQSDVLWRRRESLIEVEKLTRYFGNITVIEDVTFKVEKCEVLDFLGPNAAGKTTTMRILTCFLPASKGTARVANIDVFQYPLEVKKRIGYLPENPPLYAEMTVFSFLDFIAKIKGIDPRDRNQKINVAISYFDCRNCYLCSTKINEDLL